MSEVKGERETQISMEVEGEMAHVDGGDGSGEVNWDFGEETQPVNKDKEVNVDDRDLHSSNSDSSDLEENQSEGSEATKSTDKDGDESGQDIPSILLSAGVDADRTGPKSVLDFYQPVKIPAFLFLCAGLMIMFEEGKELVHEWHGGPKAPQDEIMAARTMLCFFGIWICGFVLTLIQYFKFVAMLVNKYVYHNLYRTPTSSRFKIILAMIITKVASTVWKFETSVLVCDGRNDNYPACEDEFPFTISYRLSVDLGCEYDPSRALCRRLLLQVPMMFLSIVSFIFGKFIIPALIHRFRRVEEAELVKRATSSKRRN